MAVQPLPHWGPHSAERSRLFKKVLAGTFSTNSQCRLEALTNPHYLELGCMLPNSYRAPA